MYTKAPILDQLNDTDLAEINVDNQSWLIYNQYGQGTEFNSKWIEEKFAYGFQSCIVYATQIGCCMMMLLAYLFLTRSDKRWTFVYVLNTMALLTQIVGMGLRLSFFSSNWMTVYNQFTNDVKDIPMSTIYSQSAISCISCFVYSLIDLSLVLQVNAVTKGLHLWARRSLLLFCILLAMAQVSFLAYWASWNVGHILRGQESFNATLQLAVINFQVIGTFIFSLIFSAKLGFAIFNRRRMGLKQFGPMEVLFIMSFQCGLLPFIIAAIQYAQVPVANFYTWATTVAVLSLPLSSLWATSITNKPVYVLGETAESGGSRAFSTASTLRASIVNLKFWKGLRKSHSRPVVSSSDGSNGTIRNHHHGKESISTIDPYELGHPCPRPDTPRDIENAMYQDSHINAVNERFRATFR